MSADGTDIRPIPLARRTLGALDTGLLWGNLGVSLLVVVAGAILVPALSLPQAMLAIAAGCVIGCLMLATAGAIGAQAGVPGMVLARATLGRRGSFVPTAINVVQCLGWTVFELVVIATAAAALTDELVGVRAQWAWTVAFGAVTLALALLGPVGVVRRLVRRVTVWAVPAALVYLTWWGLHGADLGGAWGRDGDGGLTTWQGIDIVVAVTVSWIPLVADYTRFTRTPRAAFWGTGIGYLVPDVWLLGLGAFLVLTRDVTDAAALPAAVVAGGGLAIVALLALTVGESDEAFANAYSGGVSLQNLVPSAPQWLLVTVVTTAATGGALVIDLAGFQPFLLLLGSFFVPLFAVVLADWLARGRSTTAADVLHAPAWRPGALVAWLVGFATYQWLAPTGPGWWVDLVARTDPPAWGIGATLPSFAVSLALGLAVVAAHRPHTRPTAG